MQGKALVVDDSRMIRVMVRANLEAAGFTVIEAADGDEGLAVARSEAPQLIILDAIMPKMNGFDVLKELKADASTKNIPVIMLTAETSASNQIVGWSSGASEYVTKPFNPAALMVIIERVLVEGGRNDERQAHQVEKLKILDKLSTGRGASDKKQTEGGNDGEQETTRER